MYQELTAPRSALIPRVPPTSTISVTDLKKRIDAADLTEMWNTILAQDYFAASPEELSEDRRDEFLHVMSLLLTAFNR